jgi:hypothetical protein
VLAVLRELKNEENLLVPVLLLPEKWQPPEEDIPFFLVVQILMRWCLLMCKRVSDVSLRQKSSFFCFK